MIYGCAHKRLKKRRTLMHIIASAVTPIPLPSRLPAACGYRPRTPWDGVHAAGVRYAIEPCPDCEVIHRRMTAVAS